MKPMISSPGTGVQHLENFTRQLSSPSTMMPCSLLIRLGAGACLAGSWGLASASSSAAFSAWWSFATRFSSPWMRLTAFWAVKPP